MSEAQTVIREVVNGIWTFSKPFARWGFVPFGGRSTAVRLRNGDVWLLASTPLGPETRKTIDNLGPVKYIVSPDLEHYLFLADYKKAYPEAKMIAAQEVVDNMAAGPNKDLKFDGVWSTDNNTNYGFEDEIKYCFFSGFKNKDTAFLHVPSKTLIQADLLFNLPAKEQYSKAGGPSHVPLLGKMNAFTWLHPRFLWSLGVDKEAMKRDAKTVDSWDFERIIPCHGDVVEEKAKAAWKAAYKFYLHDH
ncbi:hypothetical protein AX16_010990 [Volvariella volvacea WC 439]|nr:hypothetical protein AX16_010990 [Volvariella volvacea WC 439]